MENGSEAYQKHKYNYTDIQNRVFGINYFIIKKFVSPSVYKVKVHIKINLALNFYLTYLWTNRIIFKPGSGPWSRSASVLQKHCVVLWLCTVQSGEAGADWSGVAEAGGQQPMGEEGGAGAAGQDQAGPPRGESQHWPGESAAINSLTEGEFLNMASTFHQLGVQLYSQPYSSWKRVGIPSSKRNHFQLELIPKLGIKSWNPSPKFIFV